MKDDAFDDVHAPFDYKQELQKARSALDQKVREYVSRKWEFGYRELAKRFKISTGTLVAIARGLKKKQRPGPRRKPRGSPYS